MTGDVAYPFDISGGEYRLLLSTDDTAFDGQNRLDQDQTYLTQEGGNEEAMNTYLEVYIPCRTALVLERV